MHLLDLQHYFDADIEFTGDNEVDQHMLGINRPSDVGLPMREIYILNRNQVDLIEEGLKQMLEVIQKYKSKAMSP